MTQRFPEDYPVLNPLNPALVLLGDDGTKTGQVSLNGLLAGQGNPAVLVAAEQSRAQTAEATLATNLATETNRAETTENTISANLAAEAISRASGDSANAAAITSETTRAQGAESTLTANLSAETTARQSGDATNATNIASEITARQTGDATNAAAITAETTARQTGDSTNATAITTETSRALAAESSLAGSISVVSSAVSTETTRAQGAENTLTTHLSTETSSRISGDAANATAITTETSRAQSAEGTLTTNLAAETTARQTANTSIVAGIPSTITQPNLIGGAIADIPNSSFINITLTRLSQQRALPYPAVNLANNANVSTLHYYWTAADAAAAVAAGDTQAVMNVGALMQAAFTFSATSGLPVELPYGVHELGTATLTLVGGEYIIAPKGTIISSSRPLVNFKANAQATINSLNYNAGNKISNVTFIGITFSHTYNVFYDVMTGLRVTTPDYNNWRHITGGYANPSTLIVSWQTSSVAPFTNNSNVIYFDTLPPGYSTLAAAQAALVGSTIWNPFFINDGTVVASLTSGGSTAAYQMTLTPLPQNSNSTQKASPGVIPAQGAGASLINPNQPTRPGYGPPTVDFFSVAPTFYNGNFFAVACDDFTMIDCGIRHTTNGRGLGLTGDRALLLRFIGSVTCGSEGSTPWRYGGGSDSLFQDCVFYSGDQGMQNITGFTYRNGAFAPLANQDFMRVVYWNCRACSLSAEAIAVSLSITNSSQAISWLTTTTPNIPVGNVLTLPSPLPTGLTLAQLQTSGDPWGNAVNYTTIGYQVCNGSNLYSLTSYTGSGTSSLTGNGPSGTGTGIQDGNCVWAYVGPGNSQYVYGRHSVVLPGSLVVGCTGTGPYTITLLPPAGQTNAIPKAITTQATIQFITGTPVGALTNSADVLFHGCRVISFSSSLTAGNTDSQGMLRLRLNNCEFDGSYGNGASQYTQVSPDFRIDGGAFGGMEVYFQNVGVRNPYRLVMNVVGNINNLDFRSCCFEPTRYSAQQPTLNLGGIVAGTMEDCVIWMPTSTTTAQQAVVLGAAATMDSVGLTLNNSTTNFTVRNCQFPGGQPGQQWIALSYGGQRKIFGNSGSQTTGLGAGNTGAISAQIVSRDQVDWNDYTGIDGNPYQGSAASSLVVGAMEIYNLTPAQTFTLPGATNILTVKSGTWTPSLSCANNTDLVPNVISSSGTYSVSGGQCTIAFTMTLAPTYSTSTGNLQITGLPVTVRNANFNYPLLTSYPFGPLKYPTGYTGRYLLAVNNHNYLQVIATESNAADNPIAISALTSGGTLTLSGSGVYYI